MAATLKITADPADVRRAFGVMTEEARRWEATVLRSGRRVADEQRRNSQQSVQTERQSLAQRQREQTNALNRIVGEERKASQTRQREEQNTAKMIERMRQQDVRDAIKAAHERTMATKREYSEQERAANDLVRARERAERRITQTVEREQRARTATMREVGRLAGSAASFVGRTALGVGTDALAMAQDTRQRRAGVERTLDDAFFQAGVRDPREGARLRERVFRFVQPGGEGAGLASADVASAITAVQTRYSTLQGGTEQERTQNLQSMLSAATLARNTFQDPEQVMQFAAMLQHNGITGDAQRSVLLRGTSIAQQGAVGFGEALQQMSPALASRMATVAARHVGASESVVASAKADEVLRALAEAEVAAGRGATPRNFAHVMANLVIGLTGTHRQEQLRNNIMQSHDINATQRRGLLGMFDQSGHLTGEFQRGEVFAERLRTTLGGNEALARNIFAGGGHHNAQGLRANERNAIATMMTGGPTVEAMLDQSRQFGEGDVNAGKTLVDQEQQTAIQSQQEQRDAVVANTQELTQLNQELSAFRAEHPFAASLAQHVGGEAGEALVSHLTDGSGIDWRGNTTQTRAQIANAPGFGDRQSQRMIEESVSGGVNTVNSVGKYVKGGQGEFSAENLARALAQVLPNVHMTAELTPAAAAHAASTAATSANAPTEGRR